MQRKGASRRRGEALELAILEAVWAEFSELGYLGLTMEGVAKRAGTSKPVLYRRWSTKVEMLIACIANRIPQAESVPDTGSLRGDMVALLTVARERMSVIGQTAMLGMLTEVSKDPEAREVLLGGLANELVNMVYQVIYRRSIERGELTEEQLTPRLLRLPTDLARNEFLLFGTISDEAVTSIVDEVILPALRARGASV
ncbi:TetR/AcrR family transcriptional regulator [Glycomyces dulcitolivorans]|uniref:TetR/AcrR family transcriptional regulator n=1 Tax=Glycomyces dulcitolivorans TaxID=2200759 RepID=UPI0018E56C0C|nr:TetR/AcrR family transcriptional regulator [Glycomyces dulcitolivorans]